MVDSSDIGDRLYLNAETADVYFVIGGQQPSERVPAHKCILAASSPVFRAMFYEPLKEEDDIKIVNTSAEAFKEFLRVLYFVGGEINVKNVHEVLRLGIMYDVDACVKKCDTFLLDKLRYLAHENMNENS